ncbi:MAG: hypothetical protein KME42_13870 [Tildeniella nuda ZEHNDER 1965/U140]|jgi:hypothetical protein|nr:hypothetical protein [Tildeniella nuda ZEHNDER 1965/U140]
MSNHLTKAFHRLSLKTLSSAIVSGVAAFLATGAATNHYLENYPETTIQGRERFLGVVMTHIAPFAGLTAVAAVIATALAIPERDDDAVVAKFIARQFNRGTLTATELEVLSNLVSLREDQKTNP